MPPRRYAGYLIDIEGVLVRDKRYAPVPGSVAWFNDLVARDVPHCLVSNNTTHAPADLVAALRGAGFEADESRLVTALDLGARLLAGWGKRRILWLGTPRLADWWRERGFELATDDACDAVVLGANAALGPEDLAPALPALLDLGAELVCLHRNAFFLDEEGRRRPGPGFYAAALATVARREPVTVGKPHERIYRRALEIVGVAAGQALFISDDPKTDLVGAKRLGMGTAFVLSGKYPDHGVLADLDQEEWPDQIADVPATLGGPDGGETESD